MEIPVLKEMACGQLRRLHDQLRRLRGPTTPTSSERKHYEQFENDVIIMNAAAPAASLLKIVIREKQNRSPSASYDTHEYYYPVAIDSGKKCDLYLKVRSLGKATDTQWTWRGFSHIISHRANEGRNPVYTAIEGRLLN
jgi:hypothetical protein